MNQDFDIAYTEYTQNLLDLINNSKMPYSVTISILNEITSQLQLALQEKIRQYRSSQELVNEPIDDGLDDIETE